MPSSNRASRACSIFRSPAWRLEGGPLISLPSSMDVNRVWPEKPVISREAPATSVTSVAINDVRGCLNSDTTLLNNYNLKLAVETFKNNQFSFLFNAAEKVRNARDASDLRPLETTYRQ